MDSIAEDKISNDNKTINISFEVHLTFHNFALLHYQVLSKND